MPELQNYQEFEEILGKYVISDKAKQVLADIKLVVLIAPTSGGRNTIMHRLVESGRYYYIVSDTTRPPRVNDGVAEKNGREYWFRTEEEMLAELKAGEFLEAELIHNQQVSGISIRELEKARSEHKTAITDVDIDGVHNIVRAKPDTIAIMIVPPSFDEWQKRFASRSQMRDDEQKRRLQTALKIFEDSRKQNYYHFVISEAIGQSVAIIDAVVKGQSNPHQGRAPGIIQTIEERLQEKLSQPF